MIFCFVYWSRASRVGSSDWKCRDYLVVSTASLLILFFISISRSYFSAISSSICFLSFFSGRASIFILIFSIFFYFFLLLFSNSFICDKISAIYLLISCFFFIIFYICSKLFALRNTLKSSILFFRIKVSNIFEDLIILSSSDSSWLIFYCFFSNSLI